MKRAHSVVMQMQNEFLREVIPLLIRTLSHRVDYVYMKTLKPTYVHCTYMYMYVNTTDLNNSSFIENEKRAAQVGLEPTTNLFARQML